MNFKNWKRGDTIVCVRPQKNLVLGQRYKIYGLNFSKLNEQIYIGNETGYLQYFHIKSNGLYNFLPLCLVRKIKLKRIQKL